ASAPCTFPHPFLAPQFAGPTSSHPERRSSLGPVLLLLPASSDRARKTRPPVSHPSKPVPPRCSVPPSPWQVPAHSARSRRDTCPALSPDRRYTPSSTSRGLGKATPPLRVAFRPIRRRSICRNWATKKR